MSLLVARQLTHAYRRSWGRRLPSLSGVDLAVDAGQCWGLVGPNGSGKSTLLRLLAGLAAPLAGEVTILGHPAGSLAARRLVAFAPETIVWPPALRVADVLSELAVLADARDSLRRVERAVRLTGLSALVGRRLGSLSLGQSRRVVLAQALLDELPLLLLDEPFSGLDSLVVADLRAELHGRLAHGAAVVLATHRLEDLAGLATHVLVLRDGAVVQRGPAADVLAAVNERQGLAALLGAGG